MAEKPIRRSIVPSPWGGGLLGLCSIACASALFAEPSKIMPVPTVTIYPGDVIKEAWLADRAFPAAFAAAGGAMIEEREPLVGKIARRTLLPGAPIPWNAVTAPKLVAIGSKVRIVFEEDGLTIAAYGAALQSGGVGDVVSVRNLETGLTVSGAVRSDGSVRVNGS